MNNLVSREPQFIPDMIPRFAPSWTEIFGEDRFGIFAEFSLERAHFVWRWIPPGRFKMGSPSNGVGRYDDEGPEHTVTISRGFWLGETPVTQLQWISVMGNNPSHFQGDHRPVEQVNWHESRAFAASLSESIPGLGASLPTEAQWEYACRAGTRGAFHVNESECTEPTGNDPVLNQLGWFEKNSNGATHDVKLKSKNAWGLFDMHGNVWEWCLDGERSYADRSERDPIGPLNEGAARVVRGGSWGDRARDCRAAYRGRNHPGFGWDGLGLRLSAGQEPVGGAERPMP